MENRIEQAIYMFVASYLKTMTEEDCIDGFESLNEISCNVLSTCGLITGLKKFGSDKEKIKDCLETYLEIVVEATKESGELPPNVFKFADALKEFCLFVIEHQEIDLDEIEIELKINMLNENKNEAKKYD